MTRIEDTAGETRITWRYAFGLALAVVASAIVIGVHRPHGPELKGGIVRNDASRRVVPDREARTPKMTGQHTAEREWRVTGVKLLAVARRERTVHHPWKRLTAKENEVNLQEDASVQKRPELPEPVTTGPVSPPEQVKPQVAILVVTDDSPAQERQPGEAVEYSYTQTSLETGDVTQCSAKRSGTLVEMNLEVKPGNRKTPVKGMLDYETEKKNG
jgi:hypothetical protein